MRVEEVLRQGRASGRTMPMVTAMPGSTATMKSTTSLTTPNAGRRPRGPGRRRLPRRTRAANGCGRARQPTARRCRTTTEAIATRTPAMVSALARGSTRSVMPAGDRQRSRVEVDARRQVELRQPPGAGATTTSVAAADHHAEGDLPEPAPSGPQGSGRSGKISSRAAIVIGRKAPKRLRNHSAAPTPASASSEPDAVAHVGLRQRVEPPEHAEARPAASRSAGGGRSGARRPAQSPNTRPSAANGQPGAGSDLDTRAGGGGRERRSRRRPRAEREGEDREQQGYDEPLARVVPLLVHPHILPNAGMRGCWSDRPAERLVAGEEADREDEHPEGGRAGSPCTGSAATPLTHRQAAEHQAGDAHPARNRALAPGRGDREGGEPGEQPAPRDGAGPVVEHRRVGGQHVILDADDELGVETGSRAR